MLILSKPNLTLENSYLCVSAKIPSRQMVGGRVLSVTAFNLVPTLPCGNGNVAIF